MSPAPLPALARAAHYASRRRHRLCLCRVFRRVVGGRGTSTPTRAGAPPHWQAPPSLRQAPPGGTLSRRSARQCEQSSFGVGCVCGKGGLATEAARRAGYGRPIRVAEGPLPSGSMAPVAGTSPRPIAEARRLPASAPPGTHLCHRAPPPPPPGQGCQASRPRGMQNTRRRAIILDPSRRNPGPVGTEPPITGRLPRAS